MMGLVVGYRLCSCNLNSCGKPTGSAWDREAGEAAGDGAETLSLSREKRSGEERRKDRTGERRGGGGQRSGDSLSRERESEERLRVRVDGCGCGC